MSEKFTGNEQQLKKYQKMIAWKNFYIECGNEYEAMKLDYKISRFESKYFE
jgi:hypothetical protein